MKTKLPAILIIFILCCQNKFIAQSPNWIWAKSSGGPAQDQSFSIARDATSNTFITGFFISPSVVFGSTTLNSAGGRNIFVTKYDPSGNVLWAKSAGGSGDEEGFGVCTDATGNVFVTGYFASTSLVLGTNTLSCAGTHDIFVAKYDPLGNVLWAKSAGGSTHDEGNSVSTDSFGNVFVTGYFTSPTIVFGTTTLTSAGSFDVFVVKFDPSGTLVWAKSMGGPAVDLGFSVAADGGGNAVVTGNFMGPNFVIGSNSYTLPAGHDLFVAKFDVFGNVTWLRSAGGNGTEFVRSVSVVSATDIVITGDFDGSVLVFGTNTLTTAGNKDIFKVKYDGSGNVLWAKSIGGTGNEFGLGSYGEPGGNSFLSGYFTSPSLTFGTNTLTNAGAEDILLVKLDASGNVIWAKSAGGTGTEIGSEICSDFAGNVWVTGSFCSPSLLFGTNNLSCVGILDIYTAKLSGGAVGIDVFTKSPATFQFYPNPLTNEAHILYSENLNQASLIIQNSLGEVVKEINNLSGESATFSRGNLPAGVYFYSLIEDHKSFVCGKFVICDE